MKKFIITIWFLVFALSQLILQVQAQTAEELERTGLVHFRKAYYEYTPHKDIEQANLEFSLAEEAFKEALKRNPDRVESYIHLGRTYFVQKRYGEAAAMYKKALKVAPERKEIYLKLASALEMGGDYEGAIKTLKRLRREEDDERPIRILDEFINKLEREMKKEGEQKSKEEQRP